MDFHQWQHQLREELRRLKVPSAYAKRLIDELPHHYLDMQEAALMNPQSEPSPNVIQLMGDPTEIATSAAQLPRRSWAARHPWLSYQVLPPLMSLGVLLLLILADVFLIVPAFRGRTFQPAPSLATACVILGPLHVVVATSVIAILGLSQCLVQRSLQTLGNHRLRCCRCYRRLYLCTIRTTQRWPWYRPTFARIWIPTSSTVVSGDRSSNHRLDLYGPSTH